MKDNKRESRQENRPGYLRSKEFEERVYQIKRVSKKTTGGNAIAFTALGIVGDKEGRVGAALGKSKDISRAIQTALTKAKENVVSVNLKGFTIPHEVSNKYVSAKVLIKPAPEGSGIIAGGPVRVVLEMVGVKDVSAKMLGSSNKLANVRCTIGALQKLKHKSSTVSKKCLKAKTEYKRTKKMKRNHK